METPAGRSRGHATPASGRKSALKTPKSVLTPNDDAAEKASIRRKRRSEALRLSLSDAFAGQADQHGSQQAGNSNASTGHAARPMLSEEARSALLEQCLKLATENKITDRNAWHLDLISHLPDIVGSGSVGNRSSGYNFQKMSGGLDAGVTIFSKRVDLTYKEAFQSLRGCGPNKQDDGDDDEAGCEDDGDEGIEDAAAAAAKAQKNKGRSKQQGEAADEENTLTTPEHLWQKKGDTTFAVDPLFHTMSALFDEGGAKGLLLLNRRVFNGAHIMTAPHDVPEQQFSLQPAPQQDTLLDLQPLQQQLAACSHASSATQGAAGAAASAGPVLTPGLDQLYNLLEQTRRSLPMTKQQQQQQHDPQCSNVDVASIMQLATRNLPPTPMPRAFSHTSAPSSHAAGAAGGASDQPNTSSARTGPLSPDMAAAEGDAEMADAEFPDDSECRDAQEGPVAGGLPVVASFLASCAAAGEDDEAAAVAGGAAADQDDSYGGGGFGGPEGAYGDEEGCDHPGYGDDGDSSWGQQQQQQQQEDAGRRLSMLGLGGDQGTDDGSVLDAEALQQLLGGAAGAGRKGSTMTGGGWAGSKYWKYRSAAAAAARMASGRGDAVKRASAAAHGGRSRSAAAFRIDFTSPPEGLSAALAPGSRRQTCLVTAPSSTTADTLLPEDLHYQASSLLRLFLRPTPISFARQQQGGKAPGSGEQLHSWDEEAADDGGWGGDGYDDDGADDMGAEGYNAGDLSMGDPGFSHSHMGHAESSGGAEWWSSDGELLSAPKRTTGRGVSYHRSAKQVDVRALKDLLWDSLVTVNQQHSSSIPDNAAAAAAGEGAASPSEASEAGGLPVIPFQDVIVHVPDESPAGALQDVSVHMCFICLLHLANEKGLVVRAKEDLKTLTISNVQEQEQGGTEVH